MMNKYFIRTYFLLKLQLRKKNILTQYERSTNDVNSVIAIRET